MAPKNVRSRLFSRALVRVAILVVVSGLFINGTSDAASPPDFKLKDIEGNWLTLGDHLGKDVIYVNFWATWCVPCRREMPHLQEMAEEFKEQGFMVIGVNTDPPATKSKVKPYLKQRKITFPTVFDPDNNVLDKYNPTRELPYAVLIDRTGNVHQVFPGYRAGDEIRLKETVESLLADDTPETTEE